MKNTIRALSCLLAVLMLASCMMLPAFAEEDFTGGSPWLDPEIPGNVTEDTVTDPKDNFALYANKEGYLSTVIPDGYLGGGTYIDRTVEVDAELVDLFSMADPTDSHDAELSLNMYHLFLDWDTRNALGMEPILDDLAAIEALDSIDALTAYLTESDPLDIAWSLLSIGSGTDLADSSVRSLYIDGSSLLLGDADYYLTESELGILSRECNSELVLKLLVKAGYSEEDASALLEECLAFETLLAEVSYTTEDINSPDYFSLIYNPMTLEEAAELCVPYPLLGSIANIGYDTSDCIVIAPALLSRIGELYTEENLDGMKAYFLVNTIVGNSSMLDRECNDLLNAYYNELYGTTGALSDEVYASTYTASLLAWPVAHMYCDTYFTQQDKDTINSLILEILDAYRAMLAEETFISEETCAYAIEKLDNICIRCLYPDDWTLYDRSSVSIAGPENGGTLEDALRAISAYATAKNVRELNEPVDCSEWSCIPTTVNAYCGFDDNSINIMAAFAGGVFYRSDMTTEELYGSLGHIIGHEISHAFDSGGAQFDKDGNFSDWWTEEDYTTFTALNDRIAEYFNTITPWEGQELIGETLTGEACADMGSMACMLRLASEKEDFDYDTFFRAYASQFLDVLSPVSSMNTIYQNEHPLSYLRINVVLQQFDEFLDFYGITEGDAMYLAEADRIAIW